MPGELKPRRVQAPMPGLPVSLSYFTVVRPVALTRRSGVPSGLTQEMKSETGADQVLPDVVFR